MAELKLETIGTAGVITLDKPETLNALTQTMVRGIAECLDGWRTDRRVRHVIIRSSGGRAFSAGGDIRTLYTNGREDYPSTLNFFAEEYRLNTTIKEYEKPFIALIDGIVMGGGVGVSVNGSHRVGTENIRFAMPEVGIGFFPDVGGTYFLPRFPGRYGSYCALTGARLKREEAAAAGVLTHMVGADALDGLFEALTEAADAPALLDRQCAAAASAPSLPNLASIDACFAEDSVEAILDRLDQGAGGDAEFTRSTAAIVRAKSPTSLKIALRQMQVGKAASFRACMTLEYRIVSKVLKGHDFYEGVRATIVDKDNAPKWRPASLDRVDASTIDTYFEPPAGGDLRFE